ncbi:FAD-dependent oxidoreductase [Prosthecochloris sp. N3]|uniref:FAD-dependent oxidoreductase n=1 Tax=Prosthecochloris ethylica TaxID=2743976 RepID=A0ABR9XPA1_9CHLB|nr:FAD-dependent oxidoreductase [Prosthecochloris ethylica]MBF0585753.1 FAD-dependent oxidoreductase [Prosthecochloris ethylica]MBF0635663.1 FAD-dependent oxidoreductase [Prosthecochloris ethylica]NUK46962.1 FAD-dependent oxidoreductase [Prosthecochloris ethylica]
MKSDIVIVGGGISGLSLAFYCAASGLKTTLLEKRDSVGGSFNSHRFSEDGAGFWLEMGAHTCYNSYQNLLDIVDACHMTDNMIPREKVPFSLYRDGKVLSVMSALNIFEALKSVPKIFSLKKDGLTVREYYSQIVGKGNYDQVLRHFFNAVPSQPTDDFPADMMFKSRPKRKEVLKNYTFREGLQSVAEAIARSKGINVFTSQEVTGIEMLDGRYAISTAAGVTYSAGALALAVPSRVSSKLLQPVDAGVSGHLAKLEAASVDSIGVVVRKNDLPIKPVAAMISPEDIFFSAVSRDVVPDDRFRGFAFHFKPGLSEERKMKRITEVLGISAAKFAHVYQTENTVPSLRIGHKEWLETMDGMLRGKSLLLTGNYFGGMAIEDCVSRSKSESERLKSL